jgi:hypothetical protein
MSLAAPEVMQSLMDKGLTVAAPYRTTVAIFSM